MVRLVCQNSCQRPCCGEAETVDVMRAERAVTALYKQEPEMKFGTFFSETESSNDGTSVEMTGSSECDSDGEQLHIVLDEEKPGDEPYHGNNHQMDIRKEKRKERNKRSAQAYRQRRRQQMSKVDQTLHELLEKNHLLRQKVNKLEEEKNLTLEMLKSKIKISWPNPIWIPMPTPKGTPMGMWTTPDATMTTPIVMETAVQEVTVAS